MSQLGNMQKNNSPNNSRYGIHWFRRDLRVAGNQGLRHQIKVNGPRVLGIFCIDRVFLSRPDFSFPRFQFFLKSLTALKEELQALGSDLLVLDRPPSETFPQLLEALRKSPRGEPSLITWCRDYEPFARERDNSISELLNCYGVPQKTFRDHLMIEPNELLKDDGQQYQVYSPFAKRWKSLICLPDFSKRITGMEAALRYLKDKKERHEALFDFKWKNLLDTSDTWTDQLSSFVKENEKKVQIPIPPAGSKAALGALQSFLKKVEFYKDQRDLPFEEGTSQFSLFLKNGSLTTAIIFQHLNLMDHLFGTSSRAKFASEIIWREFYYHILFHHPRVENESFLPAFRNFPWDNNPDLFEKWKAGQTGFPIVDAGMRQLNQTGWMHNRVRMIVASFLVKDLLIDWRWGEKYFMEKLLDGDMAPNNGGWQWSASTGCDPQPYFRIFNPWLQSQKFDPDGKFIKKYLPELRHLSAKAVHSPILGHPIYPEPIVDHQIQKKRALLEFTKLAKQSKGS